MQAIKTIYFDVTVKFVDDGREEKEKHGNVKNSLNMFSNCYYWSLVDPIKKILQGESCAQSLNALICVGKDLVFHECVQSITKVPRVKGEARRSRPQFQKVGSLCFCKWQVCVE